MPIYSSSDLAWGQHFCLFLDTSPLFKGFSTVFGAGQAGQIATRSRICLGTGDRRIASQLQGKLANRGALYGSCGAWLHFAAVDAHAECADLGTKRPPNVWKRWKIREPVGRERASYRLGLR
jgi:hypothetical protein